MSNSASAAAKSPRAERLVGGGEPRVGLRLASSSIRRRRPAPPTGSARPTMPLATAALSSWSIAACDLIPGQHALEQRGDLPADQGDHGRHGLQPAAPGRCPARRPRSAGRAGTCRRRRWRSRPARRTAADRWRPAASRAPRPPGACTERRMVSASKVCSVTSIDVRAAARPPPARRPRGAAAGPSLASWDRSTAPGRLKLDVLMASILSKAVSVRRRADAEPTCTAGLAADARACRQNDRHGSPSRRPAGPPRRPHRRRRRRRRLLRPDARPEQPRPAGGVRHLRPPRLQPGHRVQRRCTSRPPPRRSWSTAPSQGITGPLYIGKDTHALSQAGLDHRHRGAAGQRRHRAAPRATRTTPRPRRCPGPSWCTTPTAAPGDTADGIVVTPSHNPPRDGGFKYNPPHGGPADTDATGVIAARANELLADPSADPAQAVRLRSAATLNRFDYLGAYCEDLVNALNLHADPRGRRAHRRRPDGRRQRAVLGLHRRAPRHRPDRDQPEGRPAVGVHDPRHRRQDPDGLLLAQRDGQPDHQQGRVRHLHRQRRRLRPARHRHPRRRADEPQRLPGGGHPVPVRPPRRLASPTPASARRWSPPR